MKSQVLFELFIVTAEYALPYLGARARICLVVAPRGHAPSTVSRLPHCLGDSNVGICHEVVRVVGGAENTSARNDNDDWIDTRVREPDFGRRLIVHRWNILSRESQVALRHRRDNPWRSAAFWRSKDQSQKL